MDIIKIKGPAKLQGNVEISRAKNAYLPILAATLLNPYPTTLKNIPDLNDISTICKLLEMLGVKITWNGSDATFDASNISSYEATYDLVKTMRASILVLGPLLSRFYSAKVSLPGGCAIGARPIDIHLKNMEKMGAAIELTGGYVSASTKKLQGHKLVLSFPSVGATENLMMAAAFAEGQTIIENAALEPEIDDLANFLVAMGISVSGIGTSRIVIEGTTPEKLRPVTYEAIADRIEAATYVIAGLMTQSTITVSKMNPTHLGAVLDVLRDSGANLEIGDTYVKTFPSDLKPFKIETSPYPGFPTDVQAQMTALATVINGASIVTENIFENRFMHVPEMQRLGCKIDLQGNTVVISGGNHLVSAPVMCTDLRASAALILSALVANGETEIQRVYHLDRGYENLDQKLKQLGVSLVRYNPNRG